MTNLTKTLTRNEVARLLGKTPRTILRLDQSGELHPTRDADGHVTYDRTEVEALMKARGLTPKAPQAPGPSQLSERALIAAVLSELKGGTSMLDTTIKYELTPSMVDTFKALYARLSGAIIIDGDSREKIRAFYPQLGTAEELVKAIAYLVDRHNEFARFVFPCRKCRKMVHARAAVHWAVLMENDIFAEFTHDECAT